MALEQVRRNGPYAPLSATYYQDDDIAEAGPDAELLFLRGLAFCAGRPSDGFMSDAQVERFVAVGLPDVEKRVHALVRVGLWERVAGGYVIRAWLKWNKSAEELGQYRARDRDRKRDAPAPQVRADERSEQESEAVSDSDRIEERIPSGGGADSDAHYTSLHDTTRQNTDSSGEPTSERVSGSRDDTQDGLFAATAKPGRKRGRSRPRPEDVDTNPHFIAFWDAYPRKVEKVDARRTWLSKVQAGCDPAVIAAGSARYRDSPTRPTEARYIPHPSTWLNGERWNDEDCAHVPARPGSGAWWDN